MIFALRMLRVPDVASGGASSRRVVEGPVTCVCCHSRLSTLGGETTMPPSRPQLLHRADRRADAVPILPFSTAVSRGHGRLATSPAPWRHGAPLLSRHPGPSGFPVPPKKIGQHLPWPCNESFRPPQKKRSLAWGAGATCLWVPREKAGPKRRKTLCIKTVFPSSASLATTPN